MYNDYRIEAGGLGQHDALDLRDWFQSHGHQVIECDNAKGLYIIVRMRDGKLDFIMRSSFPDNPYKQVAKFSEPIGLEKGEWVVMSSRGVVGKIGWEYGYRNSPGTSANIAVGSATWSGPANTLVRVKELPEDVQQELIAIGERQAANWELLHTDVDNPALMPDRQRAFDLAKDCKHQESANKVVL